MILRAISTSIAVLALAGCLLHPKAPPPPDVPSAPALVQENKSRLDQIGANAEAAEFAARQIADPNVQAAVLGPLGVIRSLAPGPYPEQVRSFALAAVNQALAGKLDEASAGWTKARVDADAKATKIHELEQQVDAERRQAAIDMQRKVDEAYSKAKHDADVKERLIFTFIFFGGAALCVLAGFFIGQYAAVIPIFGPNAARMFFGAGTVLFGLGLLMRVVDRLVDEHPYLFWSGVSAVVAAIGVALVLMYSNHHHSTGKVAA